MSQSSFNLPVTRTSGSFNLSFLAFIFNTRDEVWLDHVEHCDYRFCERVQVGHFKLSFNNLKIYMVRTGVYIIDR